MNAAFEIAKWVHVGAATVSLCAAPVAMSVAKGGRVHRLAGKVYYWGMATIFVSALMMSIWRFTPFLVGVAVLSFYGTWTGERILHRKRLDAQPERIDWAAAWGSLMVGLGLIGYTVYQLISGKSFDALTVVVIIFGVAITRDGQSDLKAFRSVPTDPRHWWYEHMERMLGSFIGLVTALLVQLGGNGYLSSLLPEGWGWLVWIVPTVIGTPLIAVWIGRYRRSFAARGAAAA